MLLRLLEPTAENGVSTCPYDKLTMDVVPVEEIRPVGPLEGQSGQIPYPLRERGHFLALLTGYPVDGDLGGGAGGFCHGRGLQLVPACKSPSA